ncbi:MAG TPA: SPOR domain-containing protein [Pelomicrobium sp.]|nr:SPOR domain-containing protein [Pelomicrobium sp.]
MSRDYKNVRSRSRNTRGSSLLVGIVIGLVIGLAVALMVAWYLNRGPSPFVPPERAAKPDAPPSAPAVQGLPQDAPPPKPAAKAESRPRFEFYKILPGKEEPVTTPQEVKKVEEQPGKVTLYVQAGAFQNAADADNLKAKLALLGVVASVQTANIPDRGTWHRVRAGPFRSVEEANRVLSQLKQNGIDAVLIKLAAADRP